MTEEQISNLYRTLKTLPPEAYNWLTSSEIALETISIARELVLSREQETQLPLLILRLVAQNLPPENFKQELIKTLAINQELAEQIINALKEKILMPIEQPLRFAGVDINLLKYNAPAARAAPPAPQTTPPPAIMNKPFSAAQDKPFSAAQDKPFILHEEPSSAPQKNTAATASPSFIFTPDNTVNPSLQANPPKVIIERVVHYSAFRTPLAHVSIKPKKEEREIYMPKSKWFV